MKKETSSSDGAPVFPNCIQGKPHGFMIVNGTLVQDTVAEDAYAQMTGFFRQMLK